MNPPGGQNPALARDLERTPPPGSEQVRAGVENATWNRDQIPLGPDLATKHGVGPQIPADRQ